MKNTLSVMLLLSGVSFTACRSENYENTRSPESNEEKLGLLGSGTQVLCAPILSEIAGDAALSEQIKHDRIQVVQDPKSAETLLRIVHVDTVEDVASSWEKSRIRPVVANVTDSEIIVSATTETTGYALLEDSKKPAQGSVLLRVNLASMRGQVTIVGFADGRSIPVSCQR